MKGYWKVISVVCLCCVHSDAQEARQVEAIEADREIAFEADVLPILRRNCLACHSESESEGELILETASTALEGGDSGPAILQQDGTKSLLWERIESGEMPPED